MFLLGTRQRTRRNPDRLLLSSVQQAAAGSPSLRCSISIRSSIRSHNCRITQRLKYSKTGFKSQLYGSDIIQLFHKNKLSPQRDGNLSIVHHSTGSQVLLLSRKKTFKMTREFKTYPGFCQHFVPIGDKMTLVTERNGATFPPRVTSGTLSVCRLPPCLGRQH